MQLGVSEQPHPPEQRPRDPSEWKPQGPLKQKPQDPPSRAEAMGQANHQEPMKFLECENEEISSSTFSCLYISCEPQVDEFAKYSVQATVKINVTKHPKEHLRRGRQTDNQPGIGTGSRRLWLLGQINSSKTFLQNLRK